MTRIALVGAGSLGVITGALITKEGHDIVLVDTHREHVEAMNAGGARIVGHLEETIPVRAVLPSELSGVYDLVLLLTKQTATARALDAVLPHLNDGSLVCTLQNGTPEALVTSIVGAERTIAGNVQFSGVWQGPGVSELATTLEETRARAFDIGEIDGSRSARLEATAKILSAVGGVTVSDNITGMKWSKLLQNAAFSGVSAAVGCTFGDIGRDDVLLTVATRVVDESIRVGWADGIDIDDLHGHPVADFTEADGLPYAERAAVLRAKLEAHDTGEASMLQDLRKGIPTERDFINGRVIEVAERHHVEVPFNHALYDLISAAEDAGRLPDPATGRRVLADLLNDRAASGREGRR